MNWHSVENEANFKPALVLKTKRLKIWTVSKRSAYKIPLLILHIFEVVDILQDITLILGRKLDYNVNWMKTNGGLTRKIVSVLENTFYLWGIV
jgi:peptidyl-dipeptidase Dcp